VDRTAAGDPHRRVGYVGGGERVRPQLAGVHVEVKVRIERKGGREDAWLIADEASIRRLRGESNMIDSSGNSTSMLSVER
jgi:hypothetical protein